MHFQNTSLRQRARRLSPTLMLKAVHRTALLVLSSLFAFFFAQKYIQPHISIPSSLTAAVPNILRPFLEFPTQTHLHHHHDDQTTMSSDIDTLSTTPLALWLQSRLSNLHETIPAPDAPDADFKALFYTTFDDDAWIYHNHEKMALDAFLTRLRSWNVAVIQAEVDWKELVDATPEGRVGKEGGIVSGFFIVRRYMKFRIRASHAERLSFNTFSAKIEPKPHLPPASDGTRLRITELVITSADKAAPIHFPGIPPHETELHASTS